MKQFKSSMSKLAAVASVLGLAACGGSQPAQPASPSQAAQAGQSSSDQYGSTMGQQSTPGSEMEGPKAESPGTNAPGAETGSTSGMTGGGQSGMGTAGSTQTGNAPQTGTTGTTGMTGTSGAPNTMGGSSMDVSNLNDAQVAAVLQALNASEIQQAQLAMSKAKSPDVKRFAQKMLMAHREMQTTQATLLTRVHITPSDNAVSNQLKSDTQNEMTTLQSLSGRDFDRDYIDAQVRGHNHALELIDHMAPNVQNSEFRTDLQNARPKIEQHLKDAERIQQRLAEQPQQPQQPQ
jgi:putative membrane protein